MTITEIATLHSSDSGSLSDTNSIASKTITDFLKWELAADGAQNAYYGQFIEKPEIAVIFVVWDSLEAHQKLMNTPEYKTKIKQLQSVFDEQKPITILHVPFTPSPDPSPALGAHDKVKVTEIVFFYFSSTLSPAQKEAIMAASEHMKPVMERSEALAIYDGWALEDVVSTAGSETAAEEPSKVRVNLVGWVDVNAHVRTSQTQEFQDNIHHVVGFKEMKSTELYHTELRAV